MVRNEVLPRRRTTPPDGARATTLEQAFVPGPSFRPNFACMRMCCVVDPGGPGRRGGFGPDSLVNIFGSGKSPEAIALVFRRGSLDYGAPIVDYWPAPAGGQGIDPRL